MQKEGEGGAMGCWSQIQLILDNLWICHNVIVMSPLILLVVIVPLCHFKTLSYDDYLAH